MRSLSLGELFVVEAEAEAAEEQHDEETEDERGPGDDLAEVGVRIDAAADDSAPGRATACGVAWAGAAVRTSTSNETTR